MAGKQVQIGITITSNAAGAAAAKVALGQVGKEATTAEKQLLSYAQAAARLQSAQGNAAGAVKTLESALAQVGRESKAAIAAESQLVQANNALSRSAQQASNGMAVLPRTIAGISHEAASFVTTSLTMGGAVGVATAAVQSFADAFKFKAELESTTKAINTQLNGVRSSAQVWAEGQAFANKYKLTQQELTGAIQASVGVMRASNSTTTDLLTTLSRLQVLAPEKPIEEAARALRELQSGDTTSIKELFNIAAADANRMKAEIQGGADAVQVVARYLDKAGVGMDALAAKTEGASGKMKDLVVQQERLKMAQADLAQGPGMVVLEGQIRSTTGLTRVLTGDFQAMAGSARTSIQEGTQGMAQWNPVAKALADVIGTLTGSTKAAEGATAQYANTTGRLKDDIVAVSSSTAQYANTTGRLKDDLFTMTDAAKAHAAALVKLSDELKRVGAAGADALGRSTDTAVAFLGTLETRQAEHEQKVAEIHARGAEQLSELDERMRAAKTAKQKAAVQDEINDARRGIDEKLAAEQKGYADETAAQAAAYAEQAAAQRAHLGEMLIEYTNTQVQMGNITAEKGAELTAAIGKEFGVQKDLAAGTFADMAASIDKWAADGKGSASSLASSLSTTADAAAATKQKMEELAKKYEAELIQNFDAGKIDAEQLAKALRDIPSRVYSEVVINHRETYETGGVSNSDPSGGTGRRAKGGPVMMGKPYLVGEQGPELVVFNQSGTVIPAGPTKKLLRGGLAGGGTIGPGFDMPGGLLGVVPVGKGAAKQGGGGKGGASQALKDAVDEQRSVVELLKALIDLRGQLEAAANQQPFNLKLIDRLAERAAQFTRMVADHLIPTTEDEGDAFGRYAAAARSAIDVLGAVADLRTNLQDNVKEQPFDLNLIRGLANRAALFVATVTAQMVPTTEAAASAMAQYASSVQSVTSILGSVADLRTNLQDNAKEQPFDLNMIRQLAADAKRFTAIVRGELLPTSEEQAAEVQRYGTAVQSSVGALTSALGLTQGLFADYRSPTDAQIGMLAKDANRITRAMATAAATYDTKGLEATKLYTDAVGGVFSNVKDGLLAIEALNSNDFVLDPKKLALFQQNSLLIMNSTQALGARARQIPAADLAALQTVSAAVSGQAEALIKLAAVPFGDLPGATAGLAAQSRTLLGGAQGGGGGNTVYINVYAQPGQDVRQLGQEVMRQFNTTVGRYR